MIYSVRCLHLRECARVTSMHVCYSLLDQCAVRTVSRAHGRESARESQSAALTASRVLMERSATQPVSIQSEHCIYLNKVVDYLTPWGSPKVWEIYQKDKKTLHWKRKGFPWTHCNVKLAISPPLTDARECILCGPDDWSNDAHDACVPKIIEFLAFGEPLGITLIVISAFGALVTIAVGVRLEQQKQVKGTFQHYCFTVVGFNFRWCLLWKWGLRWWKPMMPCWVSHCSFHWWWPFFAPSSSLVNLRTGAAWPAK